MTHTETQRGRAELASRAGFAPRWFPWHIPENSAETAADSRSPSAKTE